jgi:hypothetical protein
MNDELMEIELQRISLIRIGFPCQYQSGNFSEVFVPFPGAAGRRGHTPGWI